MHWPLRAVMALLFTLGGLALLLYFVLRRFLYFSRPEVPSEAILAARRIRLEPWLRPDGALRPDGVFSSPAATQLCFQTSEPSRGRPWPKTPLARRVG